MEQQLQVLRRRAQLLSSSGVSAVASAAARRVLQLLHQQQQRESGRVYVHLDMDMFFCAVEMRDDPSIASVPMAVGSLSMLATANYAARRYGVRSAMPGFIAKRLCPSLVIVPPNFRKYKAAAEVIRHVLRRYDPALSSHSLDEASLDVTTYLRCVSLSLCISVCRPLHLTVSASLCTSLPLSLSLALPRCPSVHGGAAAGQQDSAAQRQEPRRIPHKKILRGSSFSSAPLALCEVCLIIEKMLQNRSKIIAISIILLKNIFMV